MPVAGIEPSMKTVRGDHSINVVDRMRTGPYRFNFFQAVRLLELAIDEDDENGRRAIGKDGPPHAEVVRFRSLPSHSFPAGELQSFKPQSEKDADRSAADATPPELVVSFMGLFGPNGVLPRHYTQAIIDRVRGKDFALRDFLDLFNHRMISLFYRAWSKYRLPVAFEQCRRSNQPHDLITMCLLSFVGMGTEHLCGRQRIHEHSQIYYGGHFTHHPRNAISLERIVTEYFAVPTEILQFVGRWLYLNADDQSRISHPGPRNQPNNQMSVSVVVGRRVWGVENSFRLRMGPLTYREFSALTPAGERLRAVTEFVRTYVGLEFDFDIQLVLRKEEVPACQLGGKSEVPSRLGWNTWIASRPFERDVEDAVFEATG